MTHFLFVDESGQDRRESPYEVLAGLAIEDRDLWNLIQAVQKAEIEFFGTRYSHGPRELKAKRLLKRKTYRLAAGTPPIEPEERVALARDCLDVGDRATVRHLAALSQAKLAFVERVIGLCASYHCRAFAIIVDKTARRPADESMLRKDYAFLFERFFYFLEDLGPTPMGAVVFDELERSRSHLLVGQMYAYFEQTSKGRQRASRVVPEPFFVHSDLTTGIQLVDILAYVISWGFRIRGMAEPKRDELDGLVQQACGLRHRAVRAVGEVPAFQIWSFYFLRDLRPESERACG